MNLFFLVIGTGLFLAGLSSPVDACQICVPFPKKSAADYLVEADVVLFAREDPERPFHLSPVTVLKGGLGLGKIDLFLDSASRRRLAAYPDRFAVVVGKVVDGEKAWQRVGIADGEFASIVREILASAKAWERQPKLRVEYFGKLLGHQDSQISNLALLEVGRAPYDEIKRMKDAVSRDEIHAYLENFRYVEWHALYILLLAQSEDPRDRQVIWDSLRSAAHFGSVIRLGAWATAAVEIGGEEAVEFIESEYFKAANRSENELKEVALALSVHGTNGHVHLRDRIVAAYRVLLENHPSMTAAIANDLIAWKRTELADEILGYLAAHPREFDFQTTLRLRAYVRKAGTVRD